MNPNYSNHEEPLHTPAMWARLQNLLITNPRGWENEFNIVTTVGTTTYRPRSFTDAIPFFEFLFRSQRSDVASKESPDDLVLQLMGRGRMVSDPESETIMQAAARALDQAYAAIDRLSGELKQSRDELQWHNIVFK